jgi:hypothetical protein
LNTVSDEKAYLSFLNDENAELPELVTSVGSLHNSCQPGGPVHDTL